MLKAIAKGVLQGSKLAFGGVKSLGKKGFNLGKQVANPISMPIRPSSYTKGGVFSALDDAGVYSFKRETGVRAAKGAARASEFTINKTRSLRKLLMAPPAAVGRAGMNIAKSGVGKSALRGGFALGALGMMGVGIMKGGMNQAKDIVHERYMQDFTYSKSMLHNSRVGLASGTNRMMRRGGTMGLSNSLHKTRHGRY